MSGGRIVETGPCAGVLNHPYHPYSRLLLAAQRRTRGERLASVAVETLNLIDFPTGCPFHPACPEALPVCSIDQPPECHPWSGVTVSCHLYREEVR
jgi:oligopeptide/dipeptide ABC transporter ATP-binding protein